jgi:hypothetical protein
VRARRRGGGGRGEDAAPRVCARRQGGRRGGRAGGAAGAEGTPRGRHVFFLRWRALSLTQACAPSRNQLGKGSPALAAFKAAFSGATLNRGTVVTLSAARGGKLTAVVAGAAKAPIASPELCRALFDIYIGVNPVAPAAKEALGVALAARLSA